MFWLSSKCLSGGPAAGHRGQKWLKKLSRCISLNLNLCLSTTLPKQLKEITPGYVTDLTSTWKASHCRLSAVRAVMWPGSEKEILCAKTGAVTWWRSIHLSLLLQSKRPYYLAQPTCVKVASLLWSSASETSEAGLTRSTRVALSSVTLKHQRANHILNCLNEFQKWEVN